MKDFSQTPEIYPVEIQDRVKKILDKELPGYDLIETSKTILGIIDLTTLEGADNTKKVRDLCHKASSFSTKGKDIPNVAAICVFPTLVKTARECLMNTPIHIAAAAGAFPSGQAPLKIKIEETLGNEDVIK